MKMLLFALLLLFPLPAIASPSVVRDDRGSVYVWGDGITPNTKYQVSVGGAVLTKRLIANECGVLKIPDRPSLRVASSFKINGQALPDFWAGSPIPAVPACRRGVLSFPPPSQVYYTEQSKPANGNTYRFYDVYVSGLEPFSGHDIEMNDPTLNFAVTSNACGVLAFRANSSRPIPFTSGNGIWVNTMPGGYPVSSNYPASDIPVSQGPVCKNGILYTAR